MEEPIPFRTVLNRWLLLLVGLLFFPLLALVAREPWQALDAMIGKANVVLTSADQSLDTSDLRLLDQLAIAVVKNPPDLSDAPETASGFVLLATTRTCWTTSQVQATLDQESSSWQADKIAHACAIWKSWMATRPTAEAELTAFQRVHEQLWQAWRTGQNAGLVTDDVYLTVDTGKTDAGFFSDHIAFVVGAQPWWDDAIYPGQGYEIEDNFWRSTYLPEYGGKSGIFSHNPVHDPILPRFEIDQWGTWFSAWYTRTGAPGHYNSLTIDMDASAVKEIMFGAIFQVIAWVVILMLITWLIAQRLSGWVSLPVRELRLGAEAVLGLDYRYAVPMVGQGEFITLIQTFNQMVRGLAERANLMMSLEKLLSKELAQDAAERGLMLGGESIEATALFTDFVGFSTLTRGLDARVVVSTLNEYFGLLIPIIKRWGGFPDKYIGDAIVALFGTPVRYPDHARRAVGCAIELQRTLRLFNTQRRAQGKLVFEMRVGLNSGNMMVGAIGCDDKLEFTSIGETTNLANRMESICPVGQVMAGEETWNRVQGCSFSGVDTSALTEHVVKGYSDPVRAVTFFVDGLTIEKSRTDEPS